VEKQRRTQGWYRLQNAKLSLQHRSGAIENRVASWEEARQYLEDVVIFPNGEGQEESDGAAAADDASNHLEEYTKRVQNLRLDDAMKKVGMSGAELRMQQLANLKLSHEIEDREFAASGEQLEAAYEEREKRLQSDAVKEVDEALKKEERDEEARKRASELMRPLTDDEATLVRNTLYEIGPKSEVVAQEGPDTVQRGSIQRLRPDVWLNDEVIHFFYVMLSKRDAELCAADPNRKRCHFFKSFFMTKLLNEGHRDPSMDGVYEYKNVKRWSKKVPGT
jgi:Ulp1 family protease